MALGPSSQARQQAARLIADSEQRKRARSIDELLLYEDLLRRVARRAPTEEVGPAEVGVQVIRRRSP